MSVKRKLSRRVGSYQPRKKLQLQASSIEATTVQDGELQWRQVELPDLDDAEGFYDLEEIDGIEVVPQSGRKGVLFKVRPHPIIATSDVNAY